MNRIWDKLLGVAIVSMDVANIVFTGLLFVVAVFSAGVARMVGSAAAVLGDDSVKNVVAHILGYEDDDLDESTNPTYKLFCVEHAKLLYGMVVVASSPAAAKLIASSSDPAEDWQDSCCELIGHAGTGVHPGMLHRIEYTGRLRLYYANSTLGESRMVVAAVDEATAKRLASAVTPTHTWALFDWIGYAISGTSPGVLYNSNTPTDQPGLFYVQDGPNNRHVIVTAHNWQEAKRMAEACDPSSNWSQSSCAKLGISGIELGVFRYLTQTTGNAPGHNMTSDEAGQLSA